MKNIFKKSLYKFVPFLCLLSGFSFAESTNTVKKAAEKVAPKTEVIFSVIEKSDGKFVKSCKGLDNDTVEFFDGKDKVVKKLAELEIEDGFAEVFVEELAILAKDKSVEQEIEIEDKNYNYSIDIDVFVNSVDPKVKKLVKLDLIQMDFAAGKQKVMHLQSRAAKDSFRIVYGICVMLAP